MSTLFDPLGQVTQAQTPIQLPVKAKAKVPLPPVIQQPAPSVPVVKPPLAKPTGPPVPALLSLGWGGSITDFNDKVQQLHDQAVAVNGVPPDPASMLKQAISAPPTLKQQSLASDVQFSGPPLLKALIGNAKAGGYDTFMQDHGDQVSAMLSDPTTRAETTAALATAKQIDSLAQKQESGGSFGDIAKVVGEAPYKAAVAVGKTVWAANKDLDAADTYVVSRGKKGSIAFPHLTETAPAVAQVVKGLVYSPAGIVDTAKAVGQDIYNAEVHGNFSFSNTARIAEQTKNQFLLDLAHPNGRAGYLAMDLFGFASLGAGAAARVGRVGTALGEDASLTDALHAGAAPHPLKTVPLSSGDFSENVSLAMSPLAQAIQQYIPVVGLKAKQAALDRETGGTTLAGDAIDSLGPNDPVTRFVKDALSPQRTIGRAGDIRRQAEYKAAMGLKAQLDQSTGAGVRQTVLNKLFPSWFDQDLPAGEVKAIQAMSWDDPNPIAAEEKFHQQMLEQGEGDADAHKQQLALLGLARKALQNPTPRFLDVLDNVARITAATEKMRIDMGLSAETAENRVARAGAILRGEDVVKGPDGKYGVQVGDTIVPLNKQSPGSFYTPLSDREKSQRPTASSGPIARSPSDFGLGPPVPLTELNHEMTGAILRNGDFRTDAHHLAGDGYARTVKAAQALAEHAKAFNAASFTRDNLDWIAVRDLRSIPDQLRGAVSDFSEGHITQEDVDKLPAELHKYLFPENVREEDIPNVRWIDPRLLGQQVDGPKPLGPMEKFGEFVNNLLRPAIFYSTPKYALNAIGNGAMLALDQGPFRAGVNYAKGISAKDNLSDEAYGRLLSETGSSRSESYVNPQSGAISKALADFWNRFTDKHFRAAAFIHYANLKGYKGWDQLESLLMDASNPDHVDVMKRADDSMVAFDRMSSFEKSSLRHFIFVYPWQRGAFFWSLRTIFEHPAKTALLATLGQEAYNDDKWLKEVPAWIRRTGYIPLYTGKDGNPIVVNPLSINTFSTLGDVMATLKGGVEGDKYASVGDLFGPGAQFLVHGALGVDQNGNAYPGSQWLGSAEDVLGILPAIAALKRNEKSQNPPLKPFDIANRSSLEARLNSALKQVVFSPGWLGGFGQLIGGGLLTPRELNMTASEARYWTNATPQQKQQREVNLLQRALAIQGEYLQRPVPKGVKQAVTDAAQLTQAYALQATALGRTPTAKEKLLTTIKFLKNAGRLGTSTAVRLTKQADGLATLPDINHMNAAVLTQYGHVNELRQWDSDVSKLVSLSRQPDFDQRTTTLHQYGLSDKSQYKLTDAQRLAYGRKYVNYLDERLQLAKEVKGRPDAAAQLRIFDDANDQPVGARTPIFVLKGTNTGLVKQGNIDFANRQVAHNADGSISTVRTISIGTTAGEVLIPTVINGKVVSDQKAIAHYQQTGQNLGTFKNISAANSYSVRLHDEQAVLYKSGTSDLLPSVARFRLSEGDTATQNTRLAKIAGSPWYSLSGAEKAAMGHPVPQGVSEGWASYQATVAAFRAKEQSVNKPALVKLIDQDHPGFAADYKYAALPKITRFVNSPVYKTLPDMIWFNQNIREPAEANAKAIKASGDYAFYRREWKDYITTTVEPALVKSDLGAALQKFGRSFLVGLGS